MADGADEDEAALAASVQAMGRAGWCGVEIAAGLGLSQAQLAARAAGSPALAAAEDAAKAWLAGLSRRAWAAGARFNTAAWREAVRWRFGEDAGAGDGAAAARKRPARRVRFNIPCNARVRPLPNGQCPDCGLFHRTWNEGRFWNDGDRNGNGDQADIKGR